MTEILIVFILIIANGIFAMAEFAIISARRTSLEIKANKGDAGAKVALELSGNPTNFLSTIQIGITLIGVLAGAYGGTRIADNVSEQLSGTFIGDYSDLVAFGLVVGVITYLSLVIGELLPKNLALKNPEGAAALLARPMRMVSKVAAPGVRLLTLSTEILMRVVGKGGASEPAVTEEEIKALISVGRKSGVVSDKEADFLLRVFWAADRKVREVMTPRAKLTYIDKRMTVKQFLEFNARQHYGHFPVCDGGLDNIVGMLSVKDLLRATGNGTIGEQHPVVQAAQPVFFVPESKDVLELVEEMRKIGKSVAVLVDEMGVASGLVTFKQLMGEIVGQMKQEGAEDPIHRLPDGTVQVDGAMRVHEANALLGLGLPESDDYDTVAGFLLSKLGHIPATGDVVRHYSYQLEATHVVGVRIAKVSITRIQK